MPHGQQDRHRQGRSVVTRRKTRHIDASVAMLPAHRAVGSRDLRHRPTLTASCTGRGGCEEKQTLDKLSFSNPSHRIASHHTPIPPHPSSQPRPGQLSPAPRSNIIEPSKADRSYSVITTSIAHGSKTEISCQKRKKKRDSVAHLASFYPSAMWRTLFPLFSISFMPTPLPKSPCLSHFPNALQH
ncbi:hypothetical protein J3458_004529 [Metarhizium acridum]|uniref:uncharacterized protein n=1 Tax=Metarhizium acridum TaxID=92637 RepID=UPI001C6AEC6B|nr:hypothetical protein J3458_004529 [Metarhizium acridum]